MLSNYIEDLLKYSVHVLSNYILHGTVFMF